MARTLKAKAPELVKASKPKIILFGKPGVGKTWVAMEFPGVYFLDVEGGATQPQYRKKLKDSGGVYFGKEQGSQDFQTVIDEVQTLATVEHSYQTLVIDSFSKLWLMAAAHAEAKVGSDYGRDKKEAARPTRQLLLWLERLDMNVVLICHSKAKWSRKGSDLVNEGDTFDGFEKMEYDLDLCLEVINKGGDRTAVVRKSRIEGFPYETSFPWAFKEFSTRAGEATMLRKAEAFKVATAEEVSEITRLVNAVKVDEDWQDKVFTRAGVTAWSEMDSSKIQACITALKKKLEGGANE